MNTFDGLDDFSIEEEQERLVDEAPTVDLEELPPEEPEEPDEAEEEDEQEADDQLAGDVTPDEANAS